MRLFWQVLIPFRDEDNIDVFLHSYRSWTLEVLLPFGLVIEGEGPTGIEGEGPTGGGVRGRGEGLTGGARRSRGADTMKNFSILGSDFLFAWLAKR